MEISENSYDIGSYTRQDQILNTLINLKQFDKLLTYLEVNLFKNHPNIISPSPLVLQILLTLTTISEYNNASLIKSEYRPILNQESISLRASSLLKQMIKIVNQNQNNENIETYIKFDSENLKILKNNLIQSISFLKKSERIISRSTSRGIKRKNFDKSNKEDDTNGFKSNDNDNDNDNDNNNDNDKENSNDWSPRKRQMEIGFKKLQESSKFLNFREDLGIDDYNFDDDFNENDNELNLTAEQRSLQFLKNTRLDQCLQTEKIWLAIEWCLSCSNSNDILKLQAFHNWEGIINLILDILDLEYQQIIEMENNIYLFEDTLNYNFISPFVGYKWEQKLIDLIFIKYNPNLIPIFPNELQLDKTQYLHDTSIIKTRGNFLNHKNHELIKRFLKIGFRSIPLKNKGSKISKWRKDDLISRIIRNLSLDGNYYDFINFFKINQNTNLIQIKLLLTILFEIFSKLTSYGFESHDIFLNFESDSNIELINSNWISKPYDQVLDFIKDIFINASLNDHNYLEFKTLIDDYNKLNFLIWKFLEIWLIHTKFKLDNKIIKILKKSAIQGQKNRDLILKSFKLTKEREVIPKISLIDILEKNL